jgi:hypothetical protein
MDRPSRLPVDCPRCENRGAIALDDDVILPCPLCNNWCSFCLEGVPTFVPIIRPYRGSLIAGMRPTADGEVLFEGYACDYHKATLCSYSSIAPPMIGRYEAGQAYIAMQGRVFVVRYGHGQAGNWQQLEDAAQKVVASYRYAPDGSELYPCRAELAAQVAR